MPVYLQLVEQVKHAVALGVLQPGEQLPGIRRLAEELVVNPNTIAKAYRQLELEGFIDVRHGAGNYVSPSAPRLGRAELLREASTIVRNAVTLLRAIGVTDDEMRGLLAGELRADRTDAPVR